MKKVHIKSYGCQMNVYDGQRMADVLGQEGYVETATPDDADLILLNIGGLGMETLEVLRMLKESWQFRKIPVLLVTDDETKEHEELGLRLGAEDYIRKPFGTEALTVRTRRIIDMNRYNQNLLHAWQTEKQPDGKTFAPI